MIKELANALGVEVKAPNDLLYIEENGTMNVGFEGQRKFVTYKAKSREKNKMKCFGCFKGLPYGNCNEDFEEYRKFKNTLPRSKIYEHMDALSKWRTSVETVDIFTGEELTAGKCVDGEFVFPLDFLHYYKNYDICIPYDYEAYLRDEVGIK